MHGHALDRMNLNITGNDRLLAVFTGNVEFGQLRALFGISSDPVLQWHVAPFNWLSMLVVLHIAAVVSHDLKGLGADVSGMINGHRFVEVDSGSGADTIVPEVSVTLDSLGQWQPDGKPDSTEK